MNRCTLAWLTTALIGHGLIGLEGRPFAADTTYTFSTLAGTGSPGSANGSAGTAQFNRPVAIAVDPSGNVYVAEGASLFLRKVAPDGTVTTLANRFNYPSGLATDLAGNLYIANTLEQSIEKMSTTGAFSFLAGGGRAPGSADGTGSTAKFNYPYGVAVDGAGVVYVADTFNNTIRKVTTQGVVTTLAGKSPVPGTADGTGGEARFNNPLALVSDAGGTVYVADYVSNTIRKITPDGVVTTLAGTPGPAGSTDGQGAVARFSGPYGIARDSSGNLYVAEEFNHTVRKITPDGLVSTIGGLAGEIGSADGIGGAARFNRPAGIAVDKDGNLYIADQFNNKIRKGVPPATSVTITLSEPRWGVQPGSFEFTVNGPAGRTVIVQSTADLSKWQSTRTNVLAGPWKFTESPTGSAPHQFYRVVSP